MKKEVVKYSMEELLSKMLTLPQTEIPVEHLFVDGMYTRTIYSPANCLMVGKVHKNDCINILAEGSMVIKADPDAEGIRIDAPWTGISYAGSQKSAYTLTPCTFINIFRTDRITPEEAEEDVTFSLHNKIEGGP